MKKNYFLFMLVLTTYFSFGNSTEDQINIFKKTFHKGNIQDKINVISEASLQEDDMSEIFSTSMDFVINYASLLQDDAAMITLAELTIENINRVSEEEANYFLSKVFSLYDSKIVKRAVLDSISENGYKTPGIYQLIEEYGITLLEKDYTDDESIYSVLSAMEKIQNPSFFNLFFRFATSDKVSDFVRKKAEQAISSIQINYKSNMLNIIENGTISEKTLALKLVLESEKNSDFLRAEVAEKALQESILYVGDTFNEEILDFQLIALRELRRVAWTRSSDLIVNFFNISRVNYESGLLEEKYYVEIIETVAELASTKASSLLSDYLGDLNEKTEQGISCSEPIVLSVINALGSLGNKVAFDNLLYVGYLSYSEEIIEASRVALAGLKF